MEISSRSYLTAGTAFTAAAITMAPLIAGPAVLHSPPVPLRALP